MYERNMVLTSRPRWRSPRFARMAPWPSCRADMASMPARSMPGKKRAGRRSIAVCPEHGRNLWPVGGGRGTTGVAICQDRRIDGGAGFFSEKVWCLSLAARLSLVERSEPDLPIAAQCRLLKVARSTLYYRPLPVSVDDLRLMRWLDEQFLKTPFYGSRRMVAVMQRDGFVVNRKRVKRLMRVMGIEAIYQKPNTSLGHPAHKVYPYLLRGLTIDRPNQVWCADITYVPMAKGFVYLVAVMDWFSRRVL